MRFDTTADVNSHVKNIQKGKMFISPDYHFIFRKEDGFFARWGKKLSDDPSFAPAPEILDLEVSAGFCKNNCPFCYKDNSSSKPTENMTFDTFKNIIDKFPRTLTQVAFGITGIQTNPDFIKMLAYCRYIDVIPNFTLSGIDLTDEIAREVVKYVGALAVSAYASDKNVCYNTIKKFTDLGLRQTNMHLLLSNETLPFVYEVLNDIENDPRLKEMNAVVFLSAKPKGRARGRFFPVNDEQYEALVKHCMENKIRFGFDSCGAPRFEKVIEKLNVTESQMKFMRMCSESCESSCFSSYINVRGEYWSCSFSENESSMQAIDVINAEDFVRDVWNHPATLAFRKKLLDTERDGCRFCPTFPEINV